MNVTNQQSNNFKQLIVSFAFPAFLVLIMWAVKLFETINKTDLGVYGLFPLSTKGLIGILTCPFLHGDWAHLSSNSIPFLVLGTGIFTYYKDKAWYILLFIYLISGFWTWIFAREAYHIGASGIVYGMAFFLLLSSIFRREKSLTAFAMLIIFLYGSIVWGFFPQFFPNQNISWESHLMGAIAGLAVAFYYRNDGPKPNEYIWDDESDDEDYIEEEIVEDDIVEK